MTHAEIEADRTASADNAPYISIVPSDKSMIPSAAAVPNWGSEFISSEYSPPARCADSTLAAPSGAIVSFGQCIEVSIRGGVGYNAASGVCQVLFPGQI